MRRRRLDPTLSVNPGRMSLVRRRDGIPRGALGHMLLAAYITHGARPASRPLSAATPDQLHQIDKNTRKTVGNVGSTKTVQLLRSSPPYHRLMAACFA